MAACAIRRHPAIRERLSGIRGRRIFLELSDLPLAIVIELTDDRPRVEAVSKTEGSLASIDAAIKGRFADLAALLEGRADGDALFFSRRLEFTGDTEVLVALRNALDDARLDLGELATDMFGPLAFLARPVIDAGRHAWPVLSSAIASLAAASLVPVQESLDRQAAEIELLRAEIGELRRKRSPSAAHAHRRAGP